MPRIAQLTAPGKIQIQDSPSLMAGPGETIIQVKQIGQGVNSKWLGKAVTAEINNTCIAYNRKSLCSACKNGLPLHCLERTVTGIIQLKHYRLTPLFVSSL